jgi:DNA-binding MarR family transcriptional regulator
MPQNEILFNELHNNYVLFRRTLIKELRTRLGDKFSSPNFIEILSIIDRGIVYSRDIAKVMGMSPSAVAQQINQLEADKLVVRKRTLHDKRVIRLVLTPTGKELLADGRKELVRSLDKMTAVLDDKELAEFCALFAKISKEQ